MCDKGEDECDWSIECTEKDWVRHKVQHYPIYFMPYASLLLPKACEYFMREIELQTRTIVEVRIYVGWINNLEKDLDDPN